MVDNKMAEFKVRVNRLNSKVPYLEITGEGHIGISPTVWLNELQTKVTFFNYDLEQMKYLANAINTAAVKQEIADGDNFQEPDMTKAPAKPFEVTVHQLTDCTTVSIAGFGHSDATISRQTEVTFFRTTIQIIKQLAADIYYAVAKVETQNEAKKGGN